jgi:tripartite ATP-independent transporter DctM subunit
MLRGAACHLPILSGTVSSEKLVRAGQEMFEKAISYVSKAAAGISGFIVLVMMIFTVADVFLRYTFNKPIIWNFDVQTLLIVPVVFLGLSYVQSNRAHIRIDILISRIPSDNRLWFQFFGDIIFLVFAALVTWQVGVDTIAAYRIHDFLEGIVRVPLWPAKASLTLGTGLLSVYLLFFLVQDVRALAKTGAIKAERKGWYIKLAASIVVWAALVVVTIWLKDAHPTPSAVGFISLAMLFSLLLAGTPIAAATGIVSIWGVFLLTGERAALGMAMQKPFQFIISYIMTVVPLFVAMGILAGLAGFATNAYEAARRWLQSIPGGLVHATIAGAAMFAAASGVSTAACAAFARLVLPEMFKLKVQRSLALGAVACSSTLSIMIPPSIMLITYALLTQQSVGKLLIAGIIPGLLQAALYMGLVFVRCWRNPSLIPKGERFSWKERAFSLTRAWGIVFIVFVVMGGIYTGVFTPIEAGAIGTFAAFIAVAIAKKIRARDISDALLSTISLTSSILFIIIGGLMFGVLLAQSRLPVVLTQYIADMNVPRLLILIAIMIFYLIVGCFMDALSILIITLPIVFPMIVGLGYDPIWFGILITLTVEVALVSPPYGLNLFVMQASVPDLKLGELYRGVFWFILMDAVFLALLIAFPQIAIWLPNKMMG